MERFGGSISRSSWLNYLRRLGFAFKLPSKRLVKADEKKREAFVAEYASLRQKTHKESQGTGAKLFFADIAHFRADAELRGRWVPKGAPALVDSSSPKYGEKASSYSAVCLETGEVEWLELEGNSNNETSVAFLKQLKDKHPGPPMVIWDNAPAHRGEALWEYLRTAELDLRLVNLPGYSPDFNADEAIWDWVREEATGNLCLGTRAAVQGEGQQLPNRTGKPEKRSQMPLPEGVAIKAPSPLAKLLVQFRAQPKCTSHFGFSLESEPLLILQAGQRPPSLRLLAGCHLWHTPAGERLPVAVRTRRSEGPR